MPTILLVQGDEDNRELSAEWFRQSGYFVLDCASGEEALSLATAYRREIDAVVTDLVLLHMNGLRLIQELREVRPNLRALLLSGASIPAAFGAQEVTFLQTPCEHPTMVSLVRSLLATSQARR